jgi:hypothetical protein
MRNANGISIIIVAFFITFRIMLIDVELIDTNLAYLMLLMIMLNLFIIISMMYLISISENIRTIQKQANKD